MVDEGLNIAANYFKSISNTFGVNSDWELYPTVPDLEYGLHDYFQLYNYERPHQSLDYRTPAMIHFGTQG